jgi:Domain of unknown function (DUF4258)
MGGEVEGAAVSRRPDCTAPVGRRGTPLNFPNPSAPRPRNAPDVIGGRPYSGHALDRMQERGLVPSVVEDTISRGAGASGRDGSSTFATDQARVVLGPNGNVITVMGQ